jgi:hypothetical protein
LLEQALGKSLVTRDEYNILLRKYEDLVIDKLGTMEHVRAKIKKESDELAKFKERLETFTLVKAASYFSSPEVGRLIGSYSCRVCRRTMAFTIVGQPDHLTSCLFCGSTNSSSRESPTS